MTTVPAKRGPHGHYLPGVSGNPGGRTSALTTVRELMKPHAGRYVEALHKLLDDPDPGIRLSALKEAFDRLLGKAVAHIESDSRHMDVSETIKMLYLQAVQSVPSDGAKVIEATAEPTHIVNGIATPIADDKGRRRKKP